MPKALRIVAFEEVSSPILELVTKFGGQPVWLDKPCWPLSSESGKPIPFLGQVALEGDLFGELEAKMAYVFYGTYDPLTDSVDDQAKAVVLQPGYFEKPFIALDTGPTLGGEYVVVLEAHEDRAFIPEAEREYDSAASKLYFEALEFNKIGGTCAIWEDAIFPDGRPGNWQAILQLYSPDSVSGVPFDLEYGDGGCGWALLSSDRKSARFEYTSA